MLLTDVSSERAVKSFKKAGFKIIRQGKHISMAKDRTIIIIPRHKRLNPWTLKTIIKKAGLADSEFKKLL